MESFLKRLVNIGRKKFAPYYRISVLTDLLKFCSTVVKIWINHYFFVNRLSHLAAQQINFLRADHRPTHALFLKVAFVREVSMRACVCGSTLEAVIN